MALFVVFWFTICSLLYGILLKVLPGFTSLPVFNWCIPVLLGLVLPQSGRLKDAFLTPAAAKKFRLFQLIDEETRLYLSRIINREERKISTMFFLDDCERRKRALDRIFEEYNVVIAREEARKLEPPDAALNIFRVRHQAVKFKYLIRFLGYSECLRVLLVAAARPDMILPSWPPDQGDRRIGAGTGTTTATLILGRRKYEQASVQAYVLDIGGTKIKKKYQVFVSSTYLDLRNERQEVLKALLGCSCIPAGMEFFPSSDEELWSLIKSVVDECDYYLLLIGGRYGSTTNAGVSYTEAEYDYAISTGKPVLAFLHSAPSSLGGNERPDKLQRLQAFRDKVTHAHTPAYWSQATELPFVVQKALENAKRERPSVGWSRLERLS